MNKKLISIALVAVIALIFGIEWLDLRGNQYLDMVSRAVLWGK